MPSNTRKEIKKSQKPEISPNTMATPVAESSPRKFVALHVKLMASFSLSTFFITKVPSFCKL